MLEDPNTRAPQDALKLQSLLCEELAGISYRRRQVTFLLGTDEFISSERRVAMIPRHLEQLRNGLESAGLRPRILVLRGAGNRARDTHGNGFDDEAYRQAGAELVDLDQVGELDDLDVFHALKEPTDYESRLPTPWIRIGALHLASKPPGLCKVLGEARFAGILDGGTVGNCSYLKYGGDRTPIVASMSRFAGSVAGRKLVEGLDENGVEPGRVVVVGGGIAGLSAIRKVGPKTRELVVIEPYEPTRERLENTLPSLGFEQFKVLPKLTSDILDQAVGIVFAHRSGAKAAEKVCHENDIRRMTPGAAIADIAIDQGGSIAHEGYREEDDAVTSRDKTLRMLGNDYYYYAETNMPREEPHEASELHGDASLPYVTALLALCARHGGPPEAIAHLQQRPLANYRDPGDVASLDLLDCVVQDLRNGLQLVTEGNDPNRSIHITDPDVERDANLAGWVHACAKKG